MKRFSMKHFFLYYTISFLLIAAVIYSFFLMDGKSFVYALYGDGHTCFNSLVYFGRWLREIIINLFQNHNFQVPMWDMGIGYGSDILTTFNWMTLGDPLNLLAIFFTADHMEYLYGFLAVFRIYLCGLTFGIYALYHNNDKFPAIMGSLLYAFCGFSLFAGVRDVYFMSPMVYLPLLLLGVDKIFKKQKPYTFILLTTLSAVTNFYYFYMLSIWVFIYGVYRYAMLFGKEGFTFKKIIKWLSSCILYYVVGILMASFLLLPIIVQLMGSERFANHDYLPFFYSFEYYWKLIVRFTTSESMEAWTHLGYAPITVIAVTVLFLKKEKKYMAYKIGFCMCLLFLMIPAIGSFMNAGSYVVNRWVWAFSMLVSYIFVKMYPELSLLSKKEKIVTTVFCTGYAAFCCLRGTYRTNQMIVMQIILLLSLIIIMAFPLFKKYSKLWTFSVFSCVILGVLANGCFRYAEFGSNYVNGFVDAGTAWTSIHNQLPSRDLEKQTDAAEVRYDSLGTLEPMYNTAMNHGLNGTDFYFSLADGQITRYFDDLWVNVEMEHRYKGLDERSILERLAAVKYCVAGEDSYAFIPYGYDKIVKQTQAYTVYENENTLPLGYTYDKAISSEEYKRLNALQKQQALLQCAITDTDGLAKGQPVFTDTLVPYKLVPEEGIQILDDKIIVNDNQSKLHLTVQNREDSEVYLVLEGIQYEKGAGTEQEESHILFTQEKSTKKLVLYSPKHAFYHGREDYIINLGYVKNEGNKEVEIQFNRPGIYYLSSLKTVCQPMTMVNEWTDQLKADMLENIKLGTNKIEGTIDCSEKKLLCMAVPYSSGWTAYVDGVKTNTHKANGMYLGIELEKGTHEIEFRYVTPFLKLGIMLTILGIIGFAGIHTLEKRV